MPFSTWRIARDRLYISEDTARLVFYRQNFPQGKLPLFRFSQAVDFSSFAPQMRYNALLMVKFGVEDLTIALLSHAKLHIDWYYGTS